MENEEVKEEISEDETKVKKLRGRKNMPFASIPASDCFIIAEAIWKYAS
jgi:hypothetical protein